MQTNWGTVSHIDPPGKQRFERVSCGKPPPHTPARERRRCPRFWAVDGAYAVLSEQPLCLDQMEKMSLGQIAMVIFQSRPLRIGQITDIGPAGMAFDCIDGPDLPQRSLALDLVFAAGAIFLPGLAYRIVCDERLDAEAPFGEPTMRRLHLHFPLLPYQHRQDLDRFVKIITHEDRTWKQH